MAYTGQQNMAADEQLGFFSGYIRRPNPSSSGMMAQFFGEDGDDADTILALSITKFQEYQVYVNVYLVKDPNGQIMKQGEHYPLISTFIGFLRRSLPKPGGMMAQIFAPNGEHADSVANLSKSDYQDCLVFVDVRGSLASRDADSVQAQNILEIDNHYLEKITKQQKKEFQKKEKVFHKMNEKLEFSEFLKRIEVLTALGNSEEYKEWLTNTHTCSHIQDTPCLNNSGVAAVNLVKPLNYLPCCAEHVKDLQSDDHFEKNRHYYEMKDLLLRKQWALSIMKKKFSYDGASEPDPTRVIDWAASKNLSRFLPANYQAIL